MEKAIHLTQIKDYLLGPTPELQSVKQEVSLQKLSLLLNERSGIVEMREGYFWKIFDTADELASFTKLLSKEVRPQAQKLIEETNEDAQPLDLAFWSALISNKKVSEEIEVILDHIDRELGDFYKENTRKILILIDEINSVESGIKIQLDSIDSKLGSLKEELLKDLLELKN